MRTTLTINDDIARKLKLEVKKRKDSTFKDVVNETLQLGLLARDEVNTKDTFEIKSRSMGIKRGLNYDNIGELLEQIEGE